jgi:hypothetical protein
MLPPKITESDQKKINKFGNQMILFLKLMHLRGFFLHNLGVEFFLLDENTITVETDKFLIGASQIKPVGWAATHGASSQIPFSPTEPGHPY